jgi:hypothetical protein
MTPVGGSTRQADSQRHLRRVDVDDRSGGVSDDVGTCQAALCAVSSRALASGFTNAIFAGRIMVFEATVYLRREYLAVLAAMDMRLTRYFFLWVIDVERVLVSATTFKVGRF